jgi:O-acetylserine/cysteine efflux transporter
LRHGRRRERLVRRSEFSGPITPADRIHDKICIVGALFCLYSKPMRPLHIVLGLVTVAIWGFNFVVLKVALVDIPPLLLTGLRFLFACLPVLFLPRPQGMQLQHMIIVGLTSFLGQYIFLFVAMKLGMPAGLSSVTLQLQVFVTILLSVILLRERPTAQQVLGGAVALAGLGTIAATAGQGSTIPAIAMLFIVLAASTWAIGNFTVKLAGPGAGFGTLSGVAWASLVPILPAFALSYVFESPEQWLHSWQVVRPISIAALAFTVVLSTWLGFAIWGKLLSSYTASVAAPFALLVPVFGGLSAYLILGETLTPQRMAGSLMIFVGLAIIILPWSRLWSARESRTASLPR